MLGGRFSFYLRNRFANLYKESQNFRLLPHGHWQLLVCNVAILQIEDVVMMQNPVENLL